MLEAFKEQTREGLQIDSDYNGNPDMVPVYEALLAKDPQSVADCYLLLGVQMKAHRYYYAAEGLHPERKAHLKEALDESLKHLETIKG